MLDMVSFILQFWVESDYMLCLYETLLFLCLLLVLCVYVLVLDGNRDIGILLVPLFLFLFLFLLLFLFLFLSLSLFLSLPLFLELVLFLWLRFFVYMISLVVVTSVGIFERIVLILRGWCGPTAFGLFFEV